MEKKLGLLLDFSFETWILETTRTLRLQSLLEEKMTARLGQLDPEQVPEALLPKKKQIAEIWKSFHREISEEQLIHFREFDAYPKTEEEKEKLMLCCRSTALEEVCQRKTKAKKQSHPAGSEHAFGGTEQTRPALGASR